MPFPSVIIQIFFIYIHDFYFTGFIFRVRDKSADPEITVVYQLQIVSRDSVGRAPTVSISPRQPGPSAPTVHERFV